MLSPKIIVAGVPAKLDVLDTPGRPWSVLRRFGLLDGFGTLWSALGGFVELAGALRDGVTHRREHRRSVVLQSGRIACAGALRLRLG